MTEAGPPKLEGVPFGRYVIRKRLARGGMGEVFLADQLGPAGPVRPVALKRMLPRKAGDPRLRAMFLAEMSTAASLNHPHIATTYDFGEIDGVYYLVMEYVEGLSVRQLLDILGPLPVRAAAGIAVDVAEALAYAHERTPSPVVHRDVSPHNILVSTSGAVKLLDFGIARAEDAVLGGRLEGKLAYSAPEQLRGRPADRRSDVWALGVVLYEALTGARPFEPTGSARDAQARLRLAEADRPTAVAAQRPEAAAFDPLLAAALSADLGERLPSARAFLDACRAIQAELGGVRGEELAAMVRDAGGPLKSVGGVEPITYVGFPSARSATITTPGPDGGEESRGLTPTTGARTEPDRPRRPRRAWAVGLATAAAVGLAFAWPGLRDPPSTPIAAVPGPEAPPDAGPPDATAGVEALAVSPGPTPLPPPPPEPAPPEIEPAPPRPAPAKLPPPRRRPAEERPPPKRPPAPAPAPVAEAPSGLGLLSVRAVPWARVFVDGRYVGNSPLANLPLPAGAHQLRLEPGTGGASHTTPLVVRGGQPLRVHVDFGAGSLVVDPP